ncbi:hypothetical protein MesoLj131a_30310 [Mesorhizobium sp. 131-2-1]|nr:hypothetical protein MesoLj131a_30310 [Mesorhizobium sp. 131-2-1]
MSAKAYQLRKTTEFSGLFDYLASDRFRMSKDAQRCSEGSQPEIIDDWPERIPVSKRELDLFEVHCSDLLDEIFGARS